MKGHKTKDGKFHPHKQYQRKGVSKHDRKKRFDNSKIQSLIFNKKKFSISEAKEWASDHGFKAEKVEPYKNTLRIRQFSPNKIKRGGECRTIQFGGSGVQGVLCEVPQRFAKDSNGNISTKLGSIISPPKKPPKVLLDQIKSDLEFRDKLIEQNEKLKEEIKTDPQSEFAPASREEFKENAKEIQNLSKEIKKAFNDIPKESRESIDRDLLNRLRVLR